MMKLKRSEALKIIKSPGGISDKDADIIMSEFESAGVEFAPEEPSAVEKWEKADVCYRYADGINRGPDYEKMYIETRLKGTAMRDELQARISDLESRVKEKDAKIGKHKQGVVRYDLYESVCSELADKNIELAEKDAEIDKAIKSILSQTVLINKYSTNEKQLINKLCEKDAEIERLKGYEKDHDYYLQELFKTDALTREITRLKLNIDRLK